MRAYRIIPTTILLLAALPVALLFTSASAQETGASLTVELQEYQGSGVSGNAVLTETDSGGVHVSMTLTGQELAGNHPTHIHTGTCDNFDPNPLYPLQTFDLSPVNDQGVSETDVAEVSLETLRTGDYVILVHQSAEELTHYLVCGEISGGTLGTASVATQPDQATAMHQMPSAGVGTATSTDWLISPLALTLLALAALSMVIAGTLRISRR